jgi:hypothetical protein
MNLVEEAEIQCPYCGEVFALYVDTAQGSCQITEDCTVCCRPIHLDIDCEPGEILGIRGGIG